MKASFIEDDKQILNKSFNLTTFYGVGLKGVLNYFYLSLKNDVSISWFCSVYSFFMVLGCKLARKKSVIILGGIDCANLESINYGVWLKWYKHFFLKYALKKSDVILTVDMSLKEKIENASSLKLDKIKLLRTGQKINFWEYRENKEDSIVTVAGCENIPRVLMKGLDLIKEIAILLPEYKFIIVGTSRKLLESICGEFPKNVQIEPRLPRNELLEYYQKAKIYLQPSRFEGLPGSICEAMLCGAIPIGSNVCGIPFAIGDTGKIIDSEDIVGFVEAIKICMNTKNSKNGRNRIIEFFEYERREVEFTNLIIDLIK